MPVLLQHLPGQPGAAANVGEQQRVVRQREQLQRAVRQVVLDMDDARGLRVLLGLLVVVEQLRRGGVLRAGHGDDGAGFVLHERQPRRPAGSTFDKLGRRQQGG